MSLDFSKLGHYSSLMVFDLSDILHQVDLYQREEWWSCHWLMGILCAWNGCLDNFLAGFSITLAWHRGRMWGWVSVDLNLPPRVFLRVLHTPYANNISLYPLWILPCHRLSWKGSCIINLILIWVSSGVIGSLTLSPWKKITREAHALIT